MKNPFTLTGNVTLEIYARSINEAQHQGTLCVFLFKRPLAGNDAVLLNRSTGNAYFTYTPTANANWPSSPLSRESFRLTMDFVSPPYTIQPNERLGVAISLERKNTPVEAVQILYDHPLYPARLEVDTNTPIEG
jgi:hypothetical protein